MLTPYRAAPALPLVARRRPKTRLGRFIARLWRRTDWRSFWILLLVAWREGKPYREKSTKAWYKAHRTREQQQKDYDRYDAPAPLRARLLDSVLLHLGDQHRCTEWRQFFVDHDLCCPWYQSPEHPTRCKRCKRAIKEREMMIHAGQVHIPPPFSAHEAATNYLWSNGNLRAEGPPGMATRDRALLTDLSNEALQALLAAPVPTVVLPVRLPPPGAI